KTANHVLHRARPRARRRREWVRFAVVPDDRQRLPREEVRERGTAWVPGATGVLVVTEAINGESEARAHGHAETVRRAVFGHRLAHEADERRDGQELARREEVAPADHAVALHAEAERSDGR